MATQFSNISLLEEPLNNYNFNKTSLSPERVQEQESADDFLIDPFNNKQQFLKNNVSNQFQVNSTIWNEMGEQKIQLFDSSIQDLPAQKKFKISQNKAFILQKAFFNNQSSTQSDTSSHESSSVIQSNQSLSSIQNSYYTKNEESSLNTISNFEQSHCSENQNLQSISEEQEELTKKKRGRKQNSKNKKAKSSQSKKKGEQIKYLEEEKSRKTSKRLEESKGRKLKEAEMLDNDLTNKKKEYLQEEILDKNGKFTYLQNPIEYKKARKRMQNRESAVRSRMRKRVYQDELEDRISQLEKMHKDVSEMNAGLSAQNALLKKQLAYFEDVFAKSSLLGFDNVNSNVNKNDLEEFQRQLLKKIDSKLFKNEMDQDEVYLFDKNSQLEMMPGFNRMKDNVMEDIDEQQYSQNAGSLSENPMAHLKLIRNKSNQGNLNSSGYLFLAIVFCMMCCSSLFYSPSTSSLRATFNTNYIASQFKSINIFDMNARKLMSAEPTKQQQQQQSYNLAGSLNEEDVAMKNEEKERQNSETGPQEMLQMMLSGKYTYLTYLLMSTTCFFFWLTPNCHKFRSIFNAKVNFQQYQTSQSTSHSRKSNQKAINSQQKSQILTRSQQSRQNRSQQKNYE